MLFIDEITRHLFNNGRLLAIPSFMAFSHVSISATAYICNKSCGYLVAFFCLFCPLSTTVFVVWCLCLLTALIQKMGHFLNSYIDLLSQSERNINAFSEDQLETVLSAVVVLLRRRSTDNQLCCHNDENMLEVTGVDRYGFVTEITCTKCRQIMDTTCNDDTWTKEIIKHKSQLEVGDHICWHRWYAIWHHAIVTQTNTSIRVIHYYDHLKVEEGNYNELNNKCCDSVYRINYEDCYNAEYTVLRARKLLGEERYNLLDRNCEHFSSWCKTGSTKSSQVGACWTSLGRVVVTICLRAIALVILFLIQLSHEKSEQICEGGNSTVTSSMRNSTVNRSTMTSTESTMTSGVTTTVSTVKETRCAVNETVEKTLAVVYIIVATIIFVIHLLITSGKRLTVDPSSMKTHDIENPGECCQSYSNNSHNNIVLRGCCCLINMIRILLCKAFWCLFCFSWHRHIQWCSPFTCCRRPGTLVCGLFWRIFLREVLGQIGTLIIVLKEDELGTARGFQHLPAFDRTGHIIGWVILAQVIGYVIGIILGRSIEACFECCAKAKR